MFNNTAVDLHQSSTPAVVPALVGDDSRGRGGPFNNLNLPEGPISYQVSFINTTTTAMTVVDRRGFRHVVPPTPCNGVKARVIIRLRIEARQDAWSHIEQLFAGLPDGKFDVLQKLRSLWDDLRSSQGRRTPGTKPVKSLTVDFEVEPAVFFNRNSVYVRQMDMVVSKLDQLSAPPHPMHPDAANLESISPQEVEPEGTTNVQFEIIQGDDPIQPRYISVANRVFKILAKKDERRRPGLYMTYRDADPENPKRSKVIQEQYTLEDMENMFNIFRTPEQALNAGEDLKAARKEQLAAVEHATALAQRELAEFKATTEREKEQLNADHRQREHEFREREHQLKTEASLREHQLKSEAAILEGRIREAETANRLAQEGFEAEKHRMTMEGLRGKEASDKTKALLEQQMAEMKMHYERQLAERKEWYDSRSIDRKDKYEERSKKRDDSSAVIKFLPALVLGIGALIAGLFKLFGS